MRFALLSVLLISLASSTSWALPGVLQNITLDQPADSYQQTMAASGYNNTLYSKNGIQPFARMILSNNYLAMMNKAKTGQTLTTADAFIFSQKEGSSTFFVAAVKQNKVSSIYANYQAATSDQPFSPYHLATLNEILNSHRSSCSISAIGNFTNKFNFKGHCGPHKTLLEYHPEGDFICAIYY